MSEEDIFEQIQNHMDKSLTELEDHLVKWLKEHAVSPFPVTLITDETSSKTETFWQVTQDIGINDSSYQVIYSPTENTFGLCMRTISGSACFLGLYGGLSDTVMSM